MSGLFSTSAPGDPWFRIGRVEVGTVMLVVLAVVASWIAWVAAPSLPGVLAFFPESLAQGEAWRLVTWPFANGLSLWEVLNLFFFWYFGTDLERTLGRSRMAWLLAGVWGSLTLASVLVSLFLPTGLALAGIGMIQFLVLLLWIAENPHRRFFFNIPGWVIGAVLLGLQVLVMVAGRAWGSLVSLLLGLALVAIVAKQVGLLTDYPWIPGGRRPDRPRSPRSAKAPRQQRSQLRQEQRRLSDRDRLDELLDRINELGIHNLTQAERRELSKLRERLRP